MIAYLFLFLSAFGAATLLPLQSESVLAGLLVLGEYSIVLLILVATVGNVLGSCLNWWFGMKLELLKNKKWFPISESKLLRAQNLYMQYGSAILFLSWVPIIGDPMIYAELSGDFPLGDSRQPTYKSLRPFDLVS